ncbi:hypothetical protein CW745_16350 [Psychromonas sp. psych-6C06]|uniref:hypothetical protein n=1 Tax=Psychromonas sp. psych-6C06 TaxID=2058089 RepID=UPI000C33D4BC|nr:hypothetical protein [Psychromonas sp. psych-6C06]PKF60186.1 hypothetical protein CW745_16350 [Psychromonas sp. psych-6C06]
MIDVLLIVNIIALVGLAVLTLLAKSFLPSYVSEKAKNLASKEDIASITEQIEGIKNSHAIEIEKIKAELDIKSALRQSFQAKSLDSLTAIDELLVEINLYSWKQLAEFSPNEHYVWRNVDTLEEGRNFHYYRVAIDKVKMVHGLYLTSNAKNALSELAESIGLLSSMELALSNDPDQAILNSVERGYSSAINEINKCRHNLMAELGVKS